SAHTGWLNLVNDVAKWNADGELPQADARCAGVMTLPVCLPSGRVVGVVSVEADKVGAFDEEAQAAWVGVALALIEPLRILSGVEEESGDE
ncbi:MAG: hypothetical protein Q4D82_02740, partial [Neisseria sp.]|nr:hypothetical protein [Neisseria sp.]